MNTGDRDPRARMARALVDLDALAHNIGVARRAVGDVPVMAVVKGDAYGHGLLPVARAALTAGASWLGVAQPAEALRLREDGVAAPILTWLTTPATDMRMLVAADLDIGVSTPEVLGACARAAADLGVVARVHLKVDTGMSRAGAYGDDVAELARAAQQAVADDAIEAVGAFSHLATADDPQADDVVAAQVQLFEQHLATLAEHGIHPRVRHLANSAGVLRHPSTHYDLVRPGIMLYGISPSSDMGSGRDLGLRPVMRLSAPVLVAKQVPAGTGVSYGHTYVTQGPTCLVDVPLGYADGIPRHASNTAEVLVGGRRATVAGRICMDQFVVDTHLSQADAGVRAGDEVILFGPGDDGEPTAEDWAEAAQTIPYEIVTRLGPRVERAYIGGDRG